MFLPIFITFLWYRFAATAKALALALSCRAGSYLAALQTRTMALPLVPSAVMFPHVFHALLIPYS